MVNFLRVVTSRIPKLPKAGSGVIPHSDRILNAIKSSATNGVTIQEISVQAKLNRITAAKYLAVLEAQNAVQFRRIGKAKLYTITDSSASYKDVVDGKAKSGFGG